MALFFTPGFTLPSVIGGYGPYTTVAVPGGVHQLTENGNLVAPPDLTAKPDPLLIWCVVSGPLCCFTG